MKLSTAVQSGLIPRFTDRDTLANVLRHYRVDVNAYFKMHRDVNNVHDLMDVAAHLGENHVASYS